LHPIKILLTVLLLIGIAAGAWFAFGNDVGAPPAPEHPTEHGQPAPAQQVEPAPQQQVQPAVATETPVENARQTVASGAPSNAEAEQGVRGRVVLPSGAPAPGITVYLLQSTNSDPLTLFLMHKKQQKVQPVGQTETGADGRFALGITKLDITYDLRIVSQDYPELQHKSIKPIIGNWYDAHDLVLEAGGIVTGRVVDEAGKFGIAGAHVFLTVPGLNHQMLPTPGRERGIAAVTDGAGYFRYTNAPRDGIVTLGAEADDYAYAEKANIQIKAEAPSEQTIELARGEPIAGIVVDANGKAVSAAIVTATAQSAKLPQTANATTGSDGRFQLPMLRPGPYQLVVSADNFEEVTEKPVFTNNTEVKIVLEQRGKVRLRVLSARGTPVRNYVVALRRYFANNPGGIGKVPEFRDVRVTPGDYEGEYANIRNVPNGDYVFQIVEPNHAKTLSPAFTMTAGGEPPVVEVTLTMGASITGIVVDDRGQPVAGAIVATDMNGGLAADTGFLEVFKSFLPEKHTAKTTKTDGGGRFVLNQLAFADYMVRVAHPDFCEGAALDIKLDTEGQMKDVGIVALLRGCIVEGYCSYGGQRQGQIKVTIGPPDGFRPELDQSGQPKQRLFSANTITDGDGHYRFLKRVPPGTYKIYAFKEAGSGDDVFGRFKQLKDTQRQLIVNAGQDQLSVNFDIPGQ